jgi:hypothetical protein
MTGPSCEFVESGCGVRREASTVRREPAAVRDGLGHAFVRTFQTHNKRTRSTFQQEGRSPLTPHVSRVLLLLLLPFFATAQPRVKATLPPVPADSFYRLFISPELSSWTRADLSDLQLKDGAGQPVPYLLDTLTSVSSFSLINYPLLSVRQDSARTTIELSVPESGTDHFLIQFAATAARRPATLSGSHDRQRWYSIRDDIPLMPEPRGNSGLATQEITFPYSRYPYLRLAIANAREAPLLPVLAGRISGGTAPAAWNARQRYNFSQIDSPGHSYLRIYNPKGILLERLTVGIRKPAYFSRNVTVSALRNNHWVPVAGQVLATGQTELLLPSIKDELIELAIENGDNPPLQVDSVAGTQRRYYLVAHLEKGQTYVLYAGDATAHAPQYDLAAFRDRIPSAAPELSYTLEQLPHPDAAGKKGSNRIWIWVALILGIGLLAWLTLGLLKDVKRREA